VAGCHHQKIVVVDDAVAFVGGLDLTTSRWDTPAHRADEPSRTLPNGKPYGPFHDVQMMVSGRCRRHLATLARRRWERATGSACGRRPSGATRGRPTVAPDLRDVDVAITRTEPAVRRPARR
jgi:phosphatidylserine/phosphatidylglycerophosphate/cardiolipin synthase-like enzyme